MANDVPFEIKPLTHSSNIRNANVFNLNYTNQDYWSLKARMIDLIKQNFDKDFNDFTEASIGIMLVEMWAFLADTLSFKIDQLANEIFIDTVTEPSNAFRLARLVGFKPTPPLPARTLLSGTINHPLTEDLEIATPVILDYGLPGKQRYMECFAADQNNNPKFGRPIIIPAGHLSINRIVGIEGRTYTKTITGTGAPDQVVDLDYQQILMDSVSVNIDGVAWDQVECFTTSHLRREYRIEFTSDYNGFVIFGDGKAGLIPPQGCTISLTYRIGGGIIGNCITGAIDYPVQIHVPGSSYMVTMNIKNYTRAEFGYDGDTVEDIRRKLPLYLRTQDRCVSGTDYKSVAENFATAYNGQVGKALAVLRNTGCAGNIIDIYVLVRSGGYGLIRANDNLKNELSVYLDKRKMLSHHICIKDGEVIEVDMQINLVVDKSLAKHTEILKERAQRHIINLFMLTNWDYGQILKDTDIVKALADLKEVESIDVTFTTTHSLESGQGSITVVSPRFYEIIRPDTITINFSYKDGR